jgi:glycine/D-amino acid oxidase-like deaminating enzyme
MLRGHGRTRAPVSRPRRRHRRRHHRLLGRVPPGPRRLEGRRRCSSAIAHLGHHLARRRADGHLRLDVGDLDRAAQVHARSVRAPARPRPARPPASSRCGFIEVAADRDRLEEYRRVSAFNRYCGVDVHEISPREVGELFPLARTDDVLAGFYVKDDGRVNPVDVTMALAKGARQQGATILEGVPATGVTTRAARSPASRTSHGDDRVRVRRQLRRHVGAPARRRGGREHPAAGGRALLPDHRGKIPASPRVAGARGPGSYGYFREEVGGLMIGLFEPVCAPWKVEGIPRTSRSARSAARLGAHGPVPREGDGRVPISLEKSACKKFFCGPESFTPDLRPCVGEAPELRELLRRRRPQLDRHPHRRRPRPRHGALDHHRPARRRRHRRCTSTACTPTRPTPSTGAPAPSSRSAWSTSATTRRGR